MIPVPTVYQALSTAMSLATIYEATTGRDIPEAARDVFAEATKGNVTLQQLLHVQSDLAASISEAADALRESAQAGHDAAAVARKGVALPVFIDTNTPPPEEPPPSFLTRLRRIFSVLLFVVVFAGCATPVVRTFVTAPTAEHPAPQLAIIPTFDGASQEPSDYVIINSPLDGQLIIYAPLTFEQAARIKAQTGQ
jgi:hypothetical protein